MSALDPERARAWLVSHHGLAVDRHPPGAAGVRALLAARRCIQLDPIDRIGTNADLVALARLDGVGRGGVHDHLEGHAFEHFAKQRCLLPADRFPLWRDHLAAQHADWAARRRARLPDGTLDAVLAELDARGPSTASELGDHGRVDAINWSTWTGTSKAATMALDVLWAECRVIVRGRRRGARVYDLPHRGLTTAAAPAPDAPLREALIDRVEAAGLLPEVSGPWWAMLTGARRDGTVDDLLAEGRLERVEVAGQRRSYLAPAGFRDRTVDAPDDRMRILGPLDSLLWYRPLVEHAFGFEYVWEVYKPAAQRRWGYYVCPLLHRGRLVGRFEGRFADGELVVENLWPQDGEAFDPRAFEMAIERHAAALTGAATA